MKKAIEMGNRLDTSILSSHNFVYIRSSVLLSKIILYYKTSSGSHKKLPKKFVCFFSKFISLRFHNFILVNCAFITETFF